MGNPFLEKSDNMVALDTKNIVDKAVNVTVQDIEKTGRDQYQEFVKQSLQKTVSVFDIIHKNNFPLFNRTHKRAL